MSRYKAIQARIERSAQSCGRLAKDIRLIAVTKGRDVASITPLLDAGHRDFGENRVQEALRKWPALLKDYPDVRLHLIGPLQSNKAKDALDIFTSIHSLDRESLAQKLAAEKNAAQKEFFIQVNIGAEAQKSGIAAQRAGGFIADCKALGLNIAGLMAIPPQGRDASPYFTALAELARQNNLVGLSMGMSSDFESAIRCGTTHIRVGTGIFG